MLYFLSFSYIFICGILNLIFKILFNFSFYFLFDPRVGYIKVLFHLFLLLLDIPGFAKLYLKIMLFYFLKFIELFFAASQRLKRGWSLFVIKIFIATLLITLNYNPYKYYILIEFWISQTV